MRKTVDVERLIKTLASTDVRCPHCGAVEDGYDLLYGINYDDGELVEVPCPQCQHDIPIRVWIQYVYQVEDHDA